MTWSHRIVWVINRNTPCVWPFFHPIQCCILENINKDIITSGWWFGTFFSHSVGNVIIPTHIFQRGRSTTNQITTYHSRSPELTSPRWPWLRPAVGAVAALLNLCALDDCKAGRDWNYVCVTWLASQMSGFVDNIFSAMLQTSWKRIQKARGMNVCL